MADALKLMCVLAHPDDPVDGVERRATSWEDWAVTTRVDTSAH
ncbi:MAG TPA: hypothetical protein VF914_15175 [Chloroflexia bacterium]|jgi:LmbE family N-acetylglucosaminyl deacetylase